MDRGLSLLEMVAASSGTAAALSPLVVTNYVNTTVSSLGSDVYLAQKTAGVNGAWDAAIKGSRSLPADFEIWWQHTDGSGVATSGNFVVGADAADVASGTFTDIDFGVLCDLGTWQLYQNGSSGTAGAFAAQGSWRCVKRVGSALTLYENTATMSISGATLLGTFPGTSSAPLYLKASFNNVSSYLRVYAL